VKSFKKIILENPDCIYLNYGDTSIGFRDARYTFLIYDDCLEKKVHWVAYDYIGCKILSSCESLLTELYVSKTHPNHRKALYQVEEMKSFPSHSTLRLILDYLGHYNEAKNETILDGRLYEDSGHWYFPFWQLSIFKLLNQYKSLIDDFLKTVNVSKDSVSFEDENDGGIFHKYSDVFSATNSKEEKSTSDEQRRMKQMQLDLHIKKGQLDKSIVQALQSKPKDVDTLYQRLEKQLGMPIVKIKSIFGAVPLDKLIAKKAKELNESMFPKDFDRHVLGSCMAAAALATDYSDKMIKNTLSELTYRDMIESSMRTEYSPTVLYHATYMPLVESIMKHGIVPGGKKLKNFDWSKNFVYLAADKNNAISFVECAENDNIPEEWLDEIVVFSVDVSKLDKSKLSPDEHWNPSVADDEADGWQSYQYSGIIPPDAINLL